MSTAVQHRVALSFEDGVTRFINCKEDQSVADASYRPRINIPVDCRDGACGTCKAFCESGDYDGGDLHRGRAVRGRGAGGVPAGLPGQAPLEHGSADRHHLGRGQDQRRHAQGHGHRTGPALVDHGRADDRDPGPGQARVPARAVRQHRGARHRRDPVLLVLQRPGRRVAHVPGQDHPGRGDVGVPGLRARRSATTSSCTGPHGSFFLRESDAPLLLLAGGTGLAPILSILRTLDAAGSRRPMHLLYGATTDDDVVELDTVRALAASIDGLTWDYCVADPRTPTPRTRAT